MGQTALIAQTEDRLTTHNVLRGPGGGWRRPRNGCFCTGQDTQAVRNVSVSDFACAPTGGLQGLNLGHGRSRHRPPVGPSLVHHVCYIESPPARSSATAGARPPYFSWRCLTSRTKRCLHLMRLYVRPRCTVRCVLRCAPCSRATTIAAVRRLGWPSGGKSLAALLWRLSRPVCLTFRWVRTRTPLSVQSADSFGSVATISHDI